jgi:uncharacterized protein (DUF362 family)
MCIMTNSNIKVGISRKPSVIESVRSAVHMAGGLNVKEGQSVLIKPNVNSDDPHPATTNPEVLAAVVRLVLEANPGSVIVGDRSVYWGDSIEYMKKTGIYEVAREKGVTIKNLEDEGWEQVEPEGTDHWQGGFSVSRTALGADHIVSVPVIKTHMIAGFSMALKNSLGMIKPDDRINKLHEKDYVEPDFGSMIAEVALAIKPTFVVMDGTKAMISGGPFHGEVRAPGLVVACADPVANDIAGLSILKKIGCWPRIQDTSVWSQPQIARACALGIGATKPSEIEIIGDDIPDIDVIKGYASQEAAEAVTR